MSSNQSESDDVVSRREVAWRVFAAEFDDADFSYAESDEERAPNYVVTPTGARVNRMFVVGVLTEVEPVSDDVLRARIVDPTGAFVVYAGQYQPDALAFLESADVPEFVAVTGKARTFQPEDADVVYTSIRPESINAVDAETRDHWTVRTAEQTVERIGTMADALDREERGEELRDALLAAGVRPELAAGIPLALDHYGTSETYLDAVRTLAVESAEVVAGERAEVSGLDAAPAEGGPVDTDLSAGLDVGTEAGTGTEATPTEAETATESESEPEGEPEPQAVEPASEPVEAEGSPGVTESETAEAEGATASESETESETETESGAEAETETEPEEEPEPQAVEPASEPAEAEDAFEEEPAESEATAGTESAGLGDFEPSGDSDSGSESAAVDAEEVAEEVGDEMYELSEEERQEVEEEFDVGFSSGTEIAEGGETEAEGKTETDFESTEAEAVEDTEAEAEETAAAFEAEAEGETEAEETAELDDLEDTVIDVMQELDEGDGADRDELVSTIVERYEVSQDEVADAVQDALMSGRCYESGEDNLKAI